MIISIRSLYVTIPSLIIDQQCYNNQGSQWQCCQGLYCHKDGRNQGRCRDHNDAVLASVYNGVLESDATVLSCQRHGKYQLHLYFYILILYLFIYVLYLSMQIPNAMHHETLKAIAVEDCTVEKTMAGTTVNVETATKIRTFVLTDRAVKSNFRSLKFWCI